MILCHKHETCLKGFVQGPEDVSRLIACMMQRGIIKKSFRGKYITSNTPLQR